MVAKNKDDDKAKTEAIKAEAEVLLNQIRELHRELSKQPTPDPMLQAKVSNLQREYAKKLKQQSPQKPPKVKGPGIEPWPVTLQKLEDNLKDVLAVQFERRQRELFGRTKNKSRNKHKHQTQNNSLADVATHSTSEAQPVTKLDVEDTTAVNYLGKALDIITSDRRNQDLRLATLDLLSKYYEEPTVRLCLKALLAGYSRQGIIGLYKIRIEAADFEPDTVSINQHGGKLAPITREKITGMLNALGEQSYIQVVETQWSMLRMGAVTQTTKLSLAELLIALRDNWLARQPADEVFAQEVAELIGMSEQTESARLVCEYLVGYSSYLPIPASANEGIRELLFSSVEDWETHADTLPASSLLPVPSFSMLPPLAEELRQIVTDFTADEFGFFLLYSRAGYTLASPASHRAYEAAQKLRHKPQARIAKLKGIPGAPREIAETSLGLPTISINPTSPETELSETEAETSELKLSNAEQSLLGSLLTNLRNSYVAELSQRSLVTSSVQPPSVAPVVSEGGSGSGSGSLVDQTVTSLGPDAGTQAPVPTQPSPLVLLTTAFGLYREELRAEREERLAELAAFPAPDFSQPLLAVADSTSTVTPQASTADSAELYWRQELVCVPGFLELEPLKNVIAEELAAARPRIHQWLAGWIAETFREETRRAVDYSPDTNPPWDDSGLLMDTGKPFRVSSYSTVGSFLDEPNGQSSPTFESGMGFSHQKYSDDITEQVHEKWIWGSYLAALASLPTTNPLYFRQMWDYLCYKASSINPPPGHVGSMETAYRPVIFGVNYPQAIHWIREQLMNQENDEYEELDEFLSELELELLQSLVELDLKKLLAQTGEYDKLPAQCRGVVEARVKKSKPRR